MLSGAVWFPSLRSDSDGLQIIEARLMNFLKTILKAIGLFLLIVVLWCGSVLGAVYLVERHRMQDQDCWNEMAWIGDVSRINPSEIASSARYV